MDNRKRRIAILGSTGSIGRQTLDVVRQHPDLFEVELITANNSVGLLAAQAREFDVNNAVICNETLYPELSGWLEGRDVTESWAYSDSINDRFLLEYADHAIAVNPDERLETLAKEQGWEIQDWSI